MRDSFFYKCCTQISTFKVVHRINYHKTIKNFSTLVRYFLGLFLASIAGNVFAQNSTGSTLEISQEEFITACADYRSEVIEGITNVLIDFNLLVDSLKKESIYPRSHEKIRELVTSNLIKMLSEEEDFKTKYAAIGYIEMERIHRASYMEWLESNYGYLYEYSVLVRQDFIESKFPYKLTANSSLWEELQFYEIKDEMTLVDIGTGIGHFPLIIAMAGHKGTIYMTEIDSQQISFLQKKLKDFDLGKVESKIVIIAGKEKNVALGNALADKIFFRDTYHHLKHKKDMLQSTKKHLKEGGYVYVFEAIKDFVIDKKKACWKIIKKDQILAEFIESGFTLDKEKQIGEYIMLRFSL